MEYEPGGPGAQPAGGGAGSGASTYTFTRTSRTPACSGNSRTSSANICQNAVSCPDATATRYWLYEQVVDVDVNRNPREIPGPWTRVNGEVCQTPAVAGEPGIGAVLATVQTEFVKKRPAEPALVVQPAPRVLVTAANGFSAGGDDPVQLKDTVLGLPIVITATPARWQWDFGDGSMLTTTAAGTPGTTQVSHAYDRVGDYRVGVTVEWTGTFTVGGFAGSFPIVGVARVASPTALVQAREARTELVDR